MDKKLQEYTEKFEENFPLFSVMQMDEADIVQIIDKCIEKGEPYEAEYNTEGDY